MSQKPTKPDDSECCGSGCKPCIFDVYEEKLKKWEMKSAEDGIQSKALNQIKYLPFLIVDIQNITSTLKIFKFQAITLKNSDKSEVLIENIDSNQEYELLKDFLKIKAGEYLILKGVYENVTISRSYTPILNKNDFESGVFRVIVSLLPNGKMSNFLTKTKINDVVFWRGPYQEFKYQTNSFKHLLLIGGGTGVVPLYNISKSIVENDDDDTRVKLLCTFKSVENILLRKELGMLKDYWNFSLSIYIIEDKPDFRPGYNESIIFRRIDKAVIDEEIRNHNKNEIFFVVCGPFGFNHFVKDTLNLFGIKEENIFIFWYLMFIFFLTILFFYILYILSCKQGLR